LPAFAFDLGGDMKSKKSNAVPKRVLRARQSAKLRSRIERAVEEAASPHVILTEIWNQNGVDLDRLVDDYAASHYAEGYRKPCVQNSNINNRLDRGDAALTEMHENMYSRFLLAADIGFELGFAAANRLVRGAR
jgi:hypothetical protein